MSLISFQRVLVLSTLVLASTALQAQSSAKVTGMVTDAMCGKKHAMGGTSAAKCTNECVKGGSDYALVSGDKVYTLKGDKTELDKFAGTSVVVEGEESGTTITVKSIKAA